MYQFNEEKKRMIVTHVVIALIRKTNQNSHKTPGGNFVCANNERPHSNGPFINNIYYFHVNFIAKKTITHNIFSFLFFENFLI